MEKIKQIILPKEINTEKDVVAYLLSLKNEFLEVMQVYNKLGEVNRTIEKEKHENEMTIEALEKACEIIEYRIEKKLYEKGIDDKCPSCRNKIVVKSKMFYCKNCGQKIVTSKT